jgi:hypothetical protein
MRKKLTEQGVIQNVVIALHLPARHTVGENLNCRFRPGEEK